MLLCLSPAADPGVFPSYNIFRALLISAFEGGFVLTFNTISAIGMSGLSIRGSLLRISLKCSHACARQHCWTVNVIYLINSACIWNPDTYCGHDQADLRELHLHHQKIRYFVL